MKRKLTVRVATRRRSGKKEEYWKEEYKKLFCVLAGPQREWNERETFIVLLELSSDLRREMFDDDDCRLIFLHRLPHSRSILFFYFNFLTLWHRIVCSLPRGIARSEKKNVLKCWLSVFVRARDHFQHLWLERIHLDSIFYVLLGPAYRTIISIHRSSDKLSRARWSSSIIRSVESRNRKMEKFSWASKTHWLLGRSATTLSSRWK